MEEPFIRAGKNDRILIGTPDRITVPSRLLTTDETTVGWGQEMWRWQWWRMRVGMGMMAMTTRVHVARIAAACRLCHILSRWRPRRNLIWNEEWLGNDWRGSIGSRCRWSLSCGWSGSHVCQSRIDVRIEDRRRDEGRVSHSKGSVTSRIMARRLAIIACSRGRQELRVRIWRVGGHWRVVTAIMVVMTAHSIIAAVWTVSLMSSQGGGGGGGNCKSGWRRWLFRCGWWPQMLVRETKWFWRNRIHCSHRRAGLDSKGWPRVGCRLKLLLLRIKFQRKDSGSSLSHEPTGVLSQTWLIHDCSWCG